MDHTVDQVILKCGNDTAVVERFAQQSTAIAGCAMTAHLDAIDPLREGVQVDRLSPMTSSPLESCSGRHALILQEKLLAIFFSISAWWMRWN